MMAERPACWTEGEATARAPGFRDDGRACMAWQATPTIEKSLQASPGCEGCTRLARAQAMGLAPGQMTMEFKYESPGTLRLGTVTRDMKPRWQHVKPDEGKDTP